MKKNPNGNGKINRAGLNYTLGQIEERLKNGDGIMTKLSSALDNVNDTVAKLMVTLSTLPCAANDERLKNLEEEKKRRYSLSDQIKIGVVVAIVSGIISVFATLAFTH